MLGRMGRLKAAGIAAAAIAGGVAIERLVFAAPRYRGPRSDHFDGERFRNVDPGWQTEASFLKWQAQRQRGRWRSWVDAPPGAKPEERVGDNRVRVTLVNHSTTLLQFDNVNVLTDPIWSKRCSPVDFVGPSRHRPPGIRFRDLPRIDAILLSHNHYDHLDIPTLWRLHTTHRPRVITFLGNAALLARHRMSGATELDWWQSTPLTNYIKVTAVPSQHFSARGLSDRNRTLWGGFVIAAPSGAIYFAGDSGWGEHFAQIANRFAPIRLAMLPIGAYEPHWFMKPAHINPAEAVEAHTVLGARVSVPIHYGTFELSDEGELEPVEDLRRAIKVKQTTSFQIPEHGEGFEA